MTHLRATTIEGNVINGVLFFNREKRDLNNGQIKIFSVTTPISPPETIGLSFIPDPSGQLEVEVFRGATLNATPGGTILDLFNANESSSNTAQTILREDPVVDDFGQRIADTLLAVSNRGSTTGLGDQTNAISLALRQSTTIVRLTSGIANNVVNYIFVIIED